MAFGQVNLFPGHCALSSNRPGWQPFSKGMSVALTKWEGYNVVSTQSLFPQANKLINVIVAVIEWVTQYSDTPVSNNNGEQQSTLSNAAANMVVHKPWAYSSLTSASLMLFVTGGSLPIFFGSFVSPSASIIHKFFEKIVPYLPPLVSFPSPSLASSSFVSN